MDKYLKELFKQFIEGIISEKEYDTIVANYFKEMEENQYVWNLEWSYSNGQWN